MYRIRFHGRGGQGMKTASRLLGTAFFLQGYEVQDAPRYGAERRGAPMSAYVRADHKPIYERGIINKPDLVVVADDSLIAIPAAGILKGLDKTTVFLIVSNDPEQTWRNRLNLQNPIIILKPDEEISFMSAACAGAAAGLIGIIDRQMFEKAVKEEFSELNPDLLQMNLKTALHAFDLLENHQNQVNENPTDVSAKDYQKPSWIELPLETADQSAPTIHGALTSVMIKTGLWRTHRPIIDYDLCHHCWWVCSSSCPDGVINIRQDSSPEIDYDHCKGCMICVAQCPSHAIFAIPEIEAQKQDKKEEPA